MKILIADKLPEKYIQQLEDKNLEVVFKPKLGENDLPEAAKDVDILIVRSTKVNERTINNAQKLNLIIRAGAGYNNIDIKTANKKGVSVANCPGKNSIAVAELAIGLMISLDRKIPDNVSDFRKGIWNKAKYAKAKGLFGKTLAIVGFGHIGKEVAIRALAMGMKVFARDIIPINMEGVTVFEDLSEMLPKADLITLHLPSTPETRGMFNDKLFGYMKEGAFLINTSRPDVIDEDALITAVKEKDIHAALDVFIDEPEYKQGEVHSKLQELENVYLTHHIGASTQQAQDAVAQEVVKIITELFNTNKVLHLVNNPNK